MATNPDIPPGKRFRAMTLGIPSQVSTIVWEVDRITVASDGIRYVRLVRTDDRRSEKTVSLETVLDRHYFRPA